MTDDFITILLITFSAIIGAGIAILLTTRRAKHTALSLDFAKRITDASELIDELSESSCRIISGTDGGDPLKETPSYAIGLNSRLSVLVASLDQDYEGFDAEPIKSAFIKFTKECTGGDFSAHAAHADDRITSIQKSAEKLKNELYRARH